MFSRVRNPRDLDASTAPSGLFSSSNQSEALRSALFHLEAYYPTFRGELHALSQEDDLEILADELYAFGARQERDGGHELAAQVYASLANHLPTSDITLNALKRRAQARLEALQGRGPLAGRLEILGRSFTQQASDPAMLTGMFLAGAVFQTARLATLSRLTASPTANLFTRGFGARSLSWAVGFAMEVPTFTLSTRGVQQALGQPQDWNANAISRDLLSNGLTLFLLKGSGSMGTSAMRRMGAQETSNAFVRFSAATIPQVAAFGGILGSRLVENSLGLRPLGNPGALFADSLATLLQFHVSGRLLHGITGRANETSLQIRQTHLETLSDPRSKAPWPPMIGGLLSTPMTVAPGENAASIFAQPVLMSSNGPRDTPPRAITSGDPLRTEGVEERLPAPVTANPPLFKALREKFSLNEFEIYTLLEEQPGETMWTEQSHRISLELMDHLHLVDQQLPNPNARPTLGQIMGELRRIRDMLEEIRETPDSPTADREDVRQFLGALYRIPNKAINYINNGELKDLQGSLFNASDARNILLNSIYRHQVVNQDAREPISTAAINRPPRFSVDPVNPEREIYVPNYGYRDETSTPFLEITGQDRQVVLLGEIPLERIDLSQRHYLEVIPNDNRLRPEIAGRIIEIRMTERVKIIWPEWRIRTRNAHYLEGYDIASREQLQGPNGTRLLQDQVFDRIRPGGIALLVSRDPLALQRMVQISTRNQLADVIAGSYRGHLPVEVSREDQESGNFVFLRKLGQL